MQIETFKILNTFKSLSVKTLKMFEFQIAEFLLYEYFLRG